MLPWRVANVASTALAYVRGDMAVRRVLLGVFSTAASTAACVLPAVAHDSAVPHRHHLPPVNITAPEATPPKRVARPKPSQNRGARGNIAARSNQPVTAGAGGVTPGAWSDGAASLQPTAASAMRISGPEVNAVPFLRAGEALEVVPGLIVTQHSGEGKANQYFLRGFNLDHGIDLSIKVDGMPVNMPTHGHGQGYADINFLIPELIQSIYVRKGPYYADVGDFSSAGSVEIDYLDKLPKNIAEMTFGSFSYSRALAAGSTAVGSGTLLTAIEGVKYNGPWDVPVNVRKINGVMRYSQGTATDGLTLTAMAYSNAWNSTDQVAQRAIHQVSSAASVHSIQPTVASPAASACPEILRIRASTARARSPPMSCAPTCSSTTISPTSWTTRPMAISSTSSTAAPSAVLTRATHSTGDSAGVRRKPASACKAAMTISMSACSRRSSARCFRRCATIAHRKAM